MSGRSCAAGTSSVEAHTAKMREQHADWPKELLDATERRFLELVPAKGSDLDGLWGRAARDVMPLT